MEEYLVSRKLDMRFLHMEERMTRVGRGIGAYTGRPRVILSLLPEAPPRLCKAELVQSFTDTSLTA